MKNTQEILNSGGDIDAIYEELSVLLVSKLEFLGLNLIDTFSLSSPPLTEVERAFAFIEEGEAFFADSGDIYSYLDRVGPHAEIWEKVGLVNTANIIRGLMKIKEVEQMTSGAFPDSLERRKILDGLTDLTHHMNCFLPYEAGFRGFEGKMIDFISRNADDFCQQSSDGVFCC